MHAALAIILLIPGYYIYITRCAGPHHGPHPGAAALMLFCRPAAALWLAAALALVLQASASAAATAVSAAAAVYAEHKSLNCDVAHGGIVIDRRNSTVKTVPACQAFCDTTPNCHCVVTAAAATATTPGGCWRRVACDPAACAPAPSKFNAFTKPGAPPVPPSPPPPPPPPPLVCSKAKGLASGKCIFDPAHLLRSTALLATANPEASGEAECCGSCEKAGVACTAWSVVSGFGRSVCNLYNGTGAAGEVRTGSCVSAGQLPPPPPTYPSPPNPPKAGKPCNDCPNILLMFTDDQDYVLGGWETPMKQTQARIAARGATATQWRIHTPICAPSRSEMQSGRYYMNVMNAEPTPFWTVTSGAIGHVDLTKVWPQAFPKTLREEKGYATALFGKCMNNNCGYNPAASGMNLHQMGAFDKWFEGTGYQNSRFYDNEAAGCPGWPWPEASCMTAVNTSTVGAGYLTSELGNRTIEWIQRVAAEPVRRPWFVYFATHAPHGPATPAAWYKDACVGIGSPRSNLNFNYSGHNHTACSLYPPGSSSFGGDGPRDWWNSTDFPELTSCQPGFTDEQVVQIDAEARHRCQSLLSVDDSYVAIVDAVEKLGQLDNTFILVTSDHGYNLGNHMLATAKMQAYDHSLRIPMLFAGPGIKHDSKLDWLGTQVDLAPTILGLAGIATPNDMDGRSIVPLLVSEAAAAEQGLPLPGSVRRTLSLTLEDGGGEEPQQAPMTRVASFHTYYNQGPWVVGNDGTGGAPLSSPRLDDWSNTWRALHYMADGKDLKYAEYDPFGKQTAFAEPYMYTLFDLAADPFELTNIYAATKATPAGTKLLGELHALIERWQSCNGQSCP